MAKTFTVAKNSFPDNLSNEEFNTNVKEWLDGLSIGDSATYTIDLAHVKGFWEIAVIHE